jgi:two-component system LytT family response regulator
MQKIQCILLDDELPGLKYLQILCEEISFVKVIKCFDSPVKLIEEFKNYEFNVCLLDINMPGLNGLEVAKALKNKYIIFVSAHPEYAVNAYDLEAIDFIKKPVEKERLEKALNKAHKLISEKNISKEYISWNTNLGKSIIFFDELLFITTSPGDKRDKRAYLKDDKTILLKNITIEKLLSELPALAFIQVNKGEIISRKIIQSHTADEITLKIKDASQRQISITLGDAYRKFFQSWVK